MYGSYGLHMRARPVPIERLAQSAARSALVLALGNHYASLDDAIRAVISDSLTLGAGALTVEKVKAAATDILGGGTGLETDRLIAKAWRASGKEF